MGLHHTLVLFPPRTCLWWDRCPSPSLGSHDDYSPLLPFLSLCFLFFLSFCQKIQGHIKYFPTHEQTHESHYHDHFLQTFDPLEILSLLTQQHKKATKTKHCAFLLVKALKMAWAKAVNRRKSMMPARSSGHQYKRPVGTTPRS